MSIKPFALTLVFAALTIVFTAAGCELIARWRGRAGWYIALMGALGSAITGEFLAMRTGLGDVIIPKDPRWGHYTFTTRDEITLFWLLAGAAIVPALLAVRDHRRRSAGKSANRVSVSIGLIAVLAAVSLHFKQHEWYRCRTCFADRLVFQWRFGSWPRFSIPLSTRFEEIRESYFRRDFLPSDHRHDWVVAHSSCYHFFGTTWNGGVDGRARWVTVLCGTYEIDSRFRTLVQAKLQDGSLTKSDLMATIWIPPSDVPLLPSKEEETLLTEFIIGNKP